MSIGHGADPGFLVGDINHKPGGRLTSLSTRPAVIFPDKQITPSLGRYQIILSE